MTPGFGIVVFDLQGGDLAFHFVDAERWQQIVEVHAAVNVESRRWTSDLNAVVGWLTADDRPETDAPAGAPVRRGKLLGTKYTQTYVLEHVKGEIQGPILGILTFP